MHCNHFKSSIIPITVPKSPSKGAVEAITEIELNPFSIEGVSAAKTSSMAFQLLPYFHNLFLNLFLK